MGLIESGEVYRVVEGGGSFVRVEEFRDHAMLVATEGHNTAILNGTHRATLHFPFARFFHTSREDQREIVDMYGEMSTYTVPKGVEVIQLTMDGGDKIFALSGTCVII